MQRVNAERLAAIKAAVAKMTPGKWGYSAKSGDIAIVRELSRFPIVFDLQSDDDGDGIALLVNSITDILADLEEARVVADAAARYIRAREQYDLWARDRYMPDSVPEERSAAYAAMELAVKGEAEKGRQKRGGRK